MLDRAGRRFRTGFDVGAAAPDRSSSIALALALAALLSSTAHSAVRTWSGTTDANWSVGGVGGNWSNAAAPIAGDSMTFTGTTNPATVNNLAADIAFAGLSFTNTVAGQNFSLSGARITLGGGITTTATPAGIITDTIALDMILSSSRTANLAIRHNLTIFGIVSEDASPRSWIKAGMGTLTLQGANTFSGPTQVNDGTLILSGPNGSIIHSSGVTINGATCQHHHRHPRAGCRAVGWPGPARPAAPPPRLIGKFPGRFGFRPGDVGCCGWGGAAPFFDRYLS